MVVTEAVTKAMPEPPKLLEQEFNVWQKLSQHQEMMQQKDDLVPERYTDLNIAPLHPQDTFIASAA